MRWNFPTLNSAQVQLVIDQYQVQNIIAEIMVSRDLVNSEVTQSFFSPDISQLHDPFLMIDMDKAVDRILISISEKKTILIFN